MCNILNKAHAARILGVIHDAGVQGDVSITIWQSADSNALPRCIRFYDSRTCFDHVQGTATIGQCAEACHVCRHSVIPCRDHRRIANR